MGSIQNLAHERANIGRKIGKFSDLFMQPTPSEMRARMEISRSPEEIGAPQIADIATIYGKQADILKRELTRGGVDLSSPKFAGALQELAIARAAAEAGAMTRAYRQAQMERFNKLLNLAAIERSRMNAGLQPLAMQANILGGAISPLFGVRGAFDALATEYGAYAGSRANPFYTGTEQQLPYTALPYQYS